MLSDADYMSRALLHAERGRGRTTPNPLVGAVIVSPEGVVVGQGHHERAGEAHAEVRALGAAGDRARGATMYCTLEPCAHVGRTGPCAAAIVEAGIARVVAAIEDPHPLVAGRGFAFLREHGVRVERGLGEQDARAQNAAFLSVVRRRRPIVIAKIAMSIDGCIAGASGARLALTSDAANRRVHRVRASVDAVAVGSGTVLADDPRLTARGAFRERPLLRVVFDRRLRTPPGASVFATRDAGPIVVLTSPGARRDRAARVRDLERAGARVDAVDPPSLRAMIERLVAYDVASVLVEGGAGVHRAAWEEGLIDRVQIVVTPRVVGDRGVRWLDAGTLPWSAWGPPAATALGPDVWLEADVHRTD